MAEQTSRKMFVNLAVRDLKKSMAFFSGLGFTFNPKFTDDNGACMIVSGDGYVMLLGEQFFRGFTTRELCDTPRQTETLVALSCASRAEVDDLLARALAAGGTRAMESKDHGFMFVSSFYDLDGHHWELFWMDPAAAQQEER